MCKKLFLLLIVVTVSVITAMDAGLYVGKKSKVSLIDISALAGSEIEREFWNRMELNTYLCEDEIHEEQVCESSSEESNCRLMEEQVCPPTSGKDEDDVPASDPEKCPEGGYHIWRTFSMSGSVYMKCIKCGLKKGVN